MDLGYRRAARHLPAFVAGLGSERPELWDALGDLFDGVWPECNQHGEELNYYWRQLYDVFPEWQFMLVDPGDQTILELRNPRRPGTTRPASEALQWQAAHR